MFIFILQWFKNDLRNSLYSKINYTQPEFQSMSVNDSLCIYATKQSISCHYKKRYLYCIVVFYIDDHMFTMTRRMFQRK